MEQDEWIGKRQDVEMVKEESKLSLLFCETGYEMEIFYMVESFGLEQWDWPIGREAEDAVMNMEERIVIFKIVQ